MIKKIKIFIPILFVRVGVHIADVSYFVKEGTDLDKSAASRTTSTYLVQQVSPLVISVMLIA